MSPPKWESYWAMPIQPLPTLCDRLKNEMCRQPQPYDERIRQLILDASHTLHAIAKEPWRVMQDSPEIITVHWLNTDSLMDRMEDLGGFGEWLSRDRACEVFPEELADNDDFLEFAQLECMARVERMPAQHLKDVTRPHRVGVGSSETDMDGMDNAIRELIDEVLASPNFALEVVALWKVKSDATSSS